MQHVRDGYRGLSVLVEVNIDRFLTVGVIATTIMLGAWIQTL